MMKRNINLIFIILIGLSACHSKKNITDSGGNSSSAILEKYANQLNTKAANLSNEKLYATIDSWIGVPYKYGGSSKSGTDCSGFVQQIYSSVYAKSLERTATAMVNQCKLISKSDLQEGDLVFFDISGKNSHVGIYLANNFFIHASTSKGVIISDLNMDYYVKYWGRAGRVK